MSNNIQSRLKYFDILKGWAIFFVVMGHVLTMCIREIDSCFLFKFVGKVHMPIFFFISGYFSFKSENNKIKLPSIKSRFIQLIIPAVIVGAIWIWYFPHSKLQSPINPTFDGFYFNSWKNGYWFTFCLFEIIILYTLIVTITNKIKSNYSFIITAIIIEIILIILTQQIIPQPIISLLSIDLTTLFFPIFTVGVLAKKHKKTAEYIINNNTLYTLSLLLFSITLYLVVYFWEFPSISTIGLLGLRILLHISLIIAIINIVKHYENKAEKSLIGRKVNSFWSLLGRESLSIYLLHYFFLFPLGSLKPILENMGLGFIPTFITSATIATIIILVVLAVNFVISKSNILALLILGKQHK